MAEIEITHAEWKARGEYLFGKDQYKWRFVCPVCKNVAAIEDFKKFRAQGATPSDAIQVCIGRYMPRAKVRRAFGGSNGVEQPCDYAAFGLLKISPLIVVQDDGTRVFCFAFDESVPRGTGGEHGKSKDEAEVGPSANH